MIVKIKRISYQQSLKLLKSQYLAISAHGSASVATAAFPYIPNFDCGPPTIYFERVSEISRSSV